MSNSSSKGANAGDRNDGSKEPPERWSELGSELNIIKALDHAGPRPPDSADREPRQQWSASFANACAVALATEFRKSRLARTKRILPESLEKGTEPVTPLGSGVSKKIDITITDSVLGLEIGVSLKGLNFKDSKGMNYDKNLTGRLYELADEVRLVHEHLPHCFMVGIFFLPIESTDDKRSRNSMSSFASTVIKLRGRTGRLDATIGGHAMRCDASYVGLYATGDEGLMRGAIRFFNTTNAPPKRGRPRLIDTISLSQLVARIIAQATFSLSTMDKWGDPEVDEATGSEEAPHREVEPSDLEELLDDGLQESDNSE